MTDTTPQSAQVLTEQDVQALIKKTAESIDSFNIVMTHWHLVSRATEQAILTKLQAATPAKRNQHEHNSTLSQLQDQPISAPATVLVEVPHLRGDFQGGLVSRQPCKGMNCGTTTFDHSPECQAEHAAACAGGRFVKADTPADPAQALTDELIDQIAEEHSDSSAGYIDRPKDFHVFEAQSLTAFVRDIEARTRAALAQQAPAQAVDTRYKVPTHDGKGAWTFTKPQPECILEEQALYTSPPAQAQQAAGVPEGWSLSFESDRAIKVQGPGMGCIVTDIEMFDRKVPSEVLYALCRDLLAAAPTAPAQVPDDVRRDAERINWLERKFKTSTVYMDGMHPWHPTHLDLRNLRGPTFRSAIDAAMSAQQAKDGGA